MKHKILTLFLAIVASVGTLFAEVYSGNCGAEGDGSNLQWTLDSETGLLSIQGAGIMADYSCRNRYFTASPPAPWYEYNSIINAIVVGEGVTYIGNCAFVECNIDSLVIPVSLEAIGHFIISGFNIYYGTPPSHTNIGKIIWKARNCADFDGSHNNMYDTYRMALWFHNRESTGESGLIRPNSIGQFIFAEGVEHIPAWLGAFSDTDIQLPNSIKSIGEYAIFGKTIGVGSPIEKHEYYSYCEGNTTPSWLYPYLNKGDIDDTILEKYWESDNDPGDPGSGGLSTLQPSMSGVYSHKTRDAEFRDNIVYYHVSVGKIYTTELPDTTICSMRGIPGPWIEHSGEYSLIYQSVEGCDSIVKRNITLNVDTTFLPDTTVCYGEFVALSDKVLYSYRYADEFEPSEWDGYYEEDELQSSISFYINNVGGSDCWAYGECFPSFNCEKYSEDHKVECTEGIIEEFRNWVYSHFHSVYGATECPDGMDCDSYSPDGQTFYSSGKLRHTYTTVSGCDSVVTRNVIVIKAEAPELLLSKGEQLIDGESQDVGLVQIYDGLCSNCRLNEETSIREGFKWAFYDYFTVNGVRYDHTPSPRELGGDQLYWYITRNQEMSSPDYEFYLPAGEYKFVFFSQCDSVVSYMSVPEYPININGIYYRLSKNNLTATVTYRGASYDSYYNEYTGDVIIPDFVQYEGETYSVTSIGENAFNGCSEVSSITISEGVTSIGGSAFSGCMRIKKLIIPNSVTTIGSGAMYAGNLDTLIIGENVKSIGRDAFAQFIPSVTYYYTSGKQIDYVKILATTPPTMPKYQGETPSSEAKFGRFDNVYVPYGALSTYRDDYRWHIYNTHISAISHIATTSASTSSKMVFGDNEDQRHIAACGVAEGQEFGGNTIEYSGLEPNSTYADVPFYVKTIEGDSDAVVLSFTTAELELITSTSKPVSSNTAILLASTNMADIETNCGFEWKRYDAPPDMAGTKSYCPVANGVMAGRLKGLKDDVYYIYRAFYQSAAGNSYYGDWQYIFTGDDAVEFDPVLYTYEAIAVTEHEATIKGYALEGADEFTEQGFEYWADSRVLPNKKPALRYKAQLGEKQTITATGIAMKVTLTDLDQGTVYKYRTFAKFADEVVYGAEMSFTTQGEWQAYLVTFLDKDGNVISTQQVEPGEDAVAPEAPEVEGFTFEGWDIDFTNVQSNLTVTAQYTEKTEEEEEGEEEKATFTLTVEIEPAGCGTVLFDGKTIKTNTKTVNEGEIITLKAVPEEGYEFSYFLDNKKKITDVEYEVSMTADKTITVYFEEIQESIDQIVNGKCLNGKYLIDGHLYILYEGQMYDVRGARVK